VGGELGREIEHILSNRERIREISRSWQAYLTANLQLTRIASKLGASEWKRNREITGKSLPGSCESCTQNAASPIALDWRQLCRVRLYGPEDGACFSALYTPALTSEHFGRVQSCLEATEPNLIQDVRASWVLDTRLGAGR
jgi:hypothetical protein